MRKLILLPILLLPLMLGGCLQSLSLIGAGLAGAVAPAALSIGQDYAAEAEQTVEDLQAFRAEMKERRRDWRARMDDAAREQYGNYRTVAAEMARQCLDSEDAISCLKEAAQAYKLADDVAMENYPGIRDLSALSELRDDAPLPDQPAPE